MTTTTPEPAAHGRAGDFTRIVIAYAVALAAAIAVGWALRDQHPIAIVAAADVVATLVVFGFSVAFDNSSVYDPYWSVAPIPIALYWGHLGGPNGTGDAVVLRQLLVIALIAWWAVRLTFNWARGWNGIDHEDWRYVDFRTRTGGMYWLVSLAGIHMAPTLWVLLGCMALYPALAVGSQPLGWLDAVATLVTAGAIWLEMRADKELRIFRTTPGRPREDILDTGVWSGSRHPNYFGEVAFWWGLFLFGVSADSAYAWTIIGPISITLLFRFISLRLIETRMQERRPGYAAHMERVPMLVPRPPRG